MGVQIATCVWRVSDSLWEYLAHQKWQRRLCYCYPELHKTQTSIVRSVLPQHLTQAAPDRRSLRDRGHVLWRVRVPYLAGKET